MKRLLVRAGPASRWLPVVSAWLGLALLTLAPAARAGLFAIPSAPLRVPQAPVVGTTLQQRLDSFGEHIDVTQAQADGALVYVAANNATFTIQVELTQQESGVETGLYNGHDANPTLIPLFPGQAHARSFAMVSFRTSPIRAVVNLYDENAEFLGTTTWLGVDRTGMGIYAKGPLGTFYSQDSRNPGARPQWLFFAGTGVDSGSCWLAAESSPLTGAGGAYDDVLLFLAYIQNSAVTPVARTSWGQLKARFR